MSELVIGIVRARPKPFALFEKGFRPFFLLATLVAAAWVPLWLVQLAGGLDLGGYLAPTYWHAHEMVFGFAVAVVAGFLLTAASNWTQRETARGVALAFLVVLWLAGRAAMLASAVLPPVVVAGANLAFLPALTVAVARAIVAAGNRRNYPMIGMLGLLWGAQLAVHLDALAILPGGQQIGAWVGVDLIVVLMVVISGRVLPMFTRNATGAEVVSRPRLERLSIAAMVSLVFADAAGAPAVVVGVIAAVAATALIGRAARWGIQDTHRDPLLWVLHLGCAFIPLGLALRAVGALTSAIPSSMALHALTAGAIGTLTAGMMARVTLGHTGRILRADRLFAIAFGAAVLAGLARIAGGVVPSSAYLPVLHTSGTLWTIAFVLLAVRLWPMLIRGRVDGRPG